MAHKLFTLAEANRTLPLVKRVVQDIMTVYPQWKDLVAQYELIAAQARPDWGESKEQLNLKLQIDAVAAKINGYLGELEQVGCEFKGFDEGLVDFHGRLDEQSGLRPPRAFAGRGNLAEPSHGFHPQRPVCCR